MFPDVAECLGNFYKDKFLQAGALALDTTLLKCNFIVRGSRGKPGIVNFSLIFSKTLRATYKINVLQHSLIDLLRMPKIWGFGNINFMVKFSFSQSIAFFGVSPA